MDPEALHVLLFLIIIPDTMTVANRRRRRHSHRAARRQTMMPDPAASCCSHSATIRTSLWLCCLGLVLGLVLVPLAEAAVVCSTNRDCRNLVHSSSKCSSKTWTCSNPFASGCLRTLLGSDKFPNKRVCNSDDDDDATSSTCDPPDPNFNYTEVRIAPGNWESTLFNAHILQILLSELLGVPTTLETGDDIVVDENTEKIQAGRLMSFCDPANGFPHPSKAHQFEALEVANDSVGDCIAARRQSTDPKPCAHLTPEVWNGQKKKMEDALRRGVIDPVVGSGMVGKMGWCIPAFLARFCLNENCDSDDPSSSIAGSSRQRRRSTDLNSVDLGSGDGNGGHAASMLRKKEKEIVEDVESNGGISDKNEKTVEEEEVRR